MGREGPALPSCLFEDSFLKWVWSLLGSLYIAVSLQPLIFLLLFTRMGWESMVWSGGEQGYFPVSAFRETGLRCMFFP